jgi:hypothetical protein
MEAERDLGLAFGLQPACTLVERQPKTIFGWKPSAFSFAITRSILVRKPGSRLASFFSWAQVELSPLQSLIGDPPPGPVRPAQVSVRATAAPRLGLVEPAQGPPPGSIRAVGMAGEGALEGQDRVVGIRAVAAVDPLGIVTRAGQSS